MVESFSLGQSLLLALWGFIAINEMLGVYAGGWHRPLIAGTVAGIILGDVNTGLAVGATLELASLGVHCYGGAAIPDYTTGAILGTAFGILTGKGVETAMAFAIPIALLGTYLDVLARLSTTVLVHRADQCAEEGDVDKIWSLHLLGSIPWGLSRAIPIFLGTFFGAEIAQVFLDAVPLWLINGFGAAGRAMPALGIAMLLSYLPLSNYWLFAIVGFVLAAYFKLNLIAVGLLGVSIAVAFTMVMFSADRSASQDQSIGGDL